MLPPPPPLSAGLKFLLPRPFFLVVKIHLPPPLPFCCPSLLPFYLWLVPKTYLPRVGDDIRPCLPSRSHQLPAPANQNPSPMKGGGEEGGGGSGGGGRGLLWHEMNRNHHENIFYLLKQGVSTDSENIFRSRNTKTTRLSFLKSRLY